MSIDKRRCAMLLAAGVLLPLPVLTGCSSGDDDGPPPPAARDIAPAARARTAARRHAALGDRRPADDPQRLPDRRRHRHRADRRGGAARALHPRRPRPPAAQRRLPGVRQGRPREPKQVVVYKLNPKAVWSDGRALGAEDFAAQWKALRGTENAYWTARNAGYDRIEKIEPATRTTRSRSPSPSRTPTGGRCSRRCTRRA